MKNLVSIVIPVYKSVPDESELISIKQAIRILNKYEFKIVTPEGLDLSYYEKLLTLSGINYEFCSFDTVYFQGIKGYNKLLLSKQFYDRFSSSKYILIYQLDAYVFQDELEYWCGLDYDYIGAPWLEEHVKEVTDKIKETGYWKVGNGGFSLRKIQAFLDRFNSGLPVQNSEKIKSYFEGFSLFQRVIRYPVIIAKILGYKNTVKYLSSVYPDNEDMFWCRVLEDTRFALHIPDTKVASGFGLEINVGNNFQLPFGCHGWNKYTKQNIDFWKQHIPAKQKNDI